MWTDVRKLIRHSYLPTTNAVLQDEGCGYSSGNNRHNYNGNNRDNNVIVMVIIVIIVGMPCTLMK